ncbi:MAG: SDR family NAD(P)-dependent oxidoreductase [Microbacteriaceae bacterium]
MAPDAGPRVALVTGAARGIARASAIRFAAAGAKVVVADVDAQGGNETAETIRAAGGVATYVPCDVADEASVAAMVAAALDTFGRLDAAHNAVGISPDSGDTVSCTREMWDRILAVNLTGTWMCMKHQIPALVRSGGGAIVNTSSSAGLTGVAGVPAYVAAKHGVIGVSKAAALEAAGSGVRVNVIVPGSTRTPGLQEKVDSGFGIALEQYAASSPFRRLAEPDEIAAAAVWLCSDAASFVTGAVLSVDGGKMAGQMSFSSATVS